jgi:hypothetical protein
MYTVRSAQITWIKRGFALSEFADMGFTHLENVGMKIPFIL